MNKVQNLAEYVIEVTIITLDMIELPMMGPYELISLLQAKNYYPLAKMLGR